MACPHIGACTEMARRVLLDGHSSSCSVFSGALALCAQWLPAIFFGLPLEWCFDARYRASVASG